MSDDIVARLRDYHATVLAAPPYYRELTRIAADEIQRLRNELAARCGDGGAGAHTAGPTETFIPEAL